MRWPVMRLLTFEHGIDGRRQRASDARWNRVAVSEGCFEASPCRNEQWARDEVGIGDSGQQEISNCPGDRSSCSWLSRSMIHNRHQTVSCDADIDQGENRPDEMVDPPRTTSADHEDKVCLTDRHSSKTIPVLDVVRTSF